MRVAAAIVCALAFASTAQALRPPSQSEREGIDRAGTQALPPLPAACRYSFFVQVSSINDRYAQALPSVVRTKACVAQATGCCGVLEIVKERSGWRSLGNASVSRPGVPKAVDSEFAYCVRFGTIAENLMCSVALRAGWLEAHLRGSGIAQTPDGEPGIGVYTTGYTAQFGVEACRAVLAAADAARFPKSPQQPDIYARRTVPDVAVDVVAGDGSTLLAMTAFTGTGTAWGCIPYDD